MQKQNLQLITCLLIINEHYISTFEMMQESRLIFSLYSVQIHFEHKYKSIISKVVLEKS